MESWHVLDVDFTFLLVRLLRQPREPLPEVLPSSFGLPGLAVVVLGESASVSNRQIYGGAHGAHWEEVLDVRVWDFLLEQIILVQEQDLRRQGEPNKSSSSVPGKHTYDGCLLEPLRVTYRIPDGHRVLHLVLEDIRCRRARMLI